MGIYNQIQEKMQELQIQPKRSLGQNFLISDEVVHKILTTALELKPDIIVEIGPGLGSLTEGLIAIPRSLQLIELDHVFFEYWKSRGLSIIEADALTLNWNLLESSAQRLLVSNLPYQISSRLVIDRSLDLNPFQNMILMFQKEVAQRITSPPNSKEYGFLSVISQTFWTLKTVTNAGPQSFLPPPNVSSRVLLFQRKETSINDPLLFFRFVKTGFLQRRKLYLKNIKAFLIDLKIPEEIMKELLGKHKLKLTVRAEEIRIEQFICLFNELLTFRTPKP